MRERKGEISGKVTFLGRKGDISGKVTFLEMSPFWKGDISGKVTFWGWRQVFITTFKMSFLVNGLH